MSQLSQRPTSQNFARRASLALAAAVLLAPVALYSQSVIVTSDSSKTSDRWLHVRVVNSDDKNETVKVNVPLELAEKVLPAINKNQLHDGKVRINHSDLNGVDLKMLLDALHTAKDGEYVTVQATDSDVKVAKQGGYMLVHVTEKAPKNGKSSEKSKVEVKVPMKVVDALLSAGKDELDLVAALRALSANGDTELVSVKSDDSTVHIWLDSKNISE